MKNGLSEANILSCFFVCSVCSVGIVFQNDAIYPNEEDSNLFSTKDVSIEK